MIPIAAVTRQSLDVLFLCFLFSLSPNLGYSSSHLTPCHRKIVQHKCKSRILNRNPYLLSMTNIGVEHISEDDTFFCGNILDTRFTGLMYTADAPVSYLEHTMVNIQGSMNLHAFMINIHAVLMRRETT
jgi:hypothetical protein